MITTIVQFQLSDAFTPEKARQVFLESIPRFTHLGGLIRKYFLLSEDGKSGGGVYLWTARQTAEAFHTESWMEFIRSKYGFHPTVTYFECPVVVDNAIGEILTDLPDPG